MYMYIVYKITNKINNKVYIGVHKTKNPNDDYMGSGRLLCLAIKKYGIENFQKEILYEYKTKTEAYSKEKELVNKDFVKCSNTYNLKVGGIGGCPEIIKESTRKKLSEKAKGIPKSEEHIKKMRKAKIGKNNPMYGKKPWNKGKTGYSTSKKGQKRKWIHNGKISKQILFDSPIPIGFISGRYVGNDKPREKLSYKKIWINNSTKEMMIKTKEEIPVGWKKGRLCI